MPDAGYQIPDKGESILMTLSFSLFVKQRCFYLNYLVSGIWYLASIINLN